MRRRIATWYPWVVGLLGLALLGWRLFFSPASADVVRGEYLALLLLFGVLEIYRMPIRGGVASRITMIPVVTAVIIGGDLAASLISLGGLFTLVRGRRALATALFNSGTYALASIAAGAAASLAGKSVSGPTIGLDLTGPTIFTAVYFLVTSFVTGVYALLRNMGIKSADQLLNIGMQFGFVVLSMSLGMSMALTYQSLGTTSLYFLCTMLSMSAYLMSLGARVTSNREGLFNLYKAATSINGALTLREVFERANAFTKTLIQQDFAWLSLPPGSDDGTLSVAYTSSSGAVDLERATTHLLTLRTNETDRLEGRPHVWTRDEDSSSQTYFAWSAVTPLHLGKQFLGEFGMASLSVPSEVSSEKLQLLAVLSSHLALAVDNALKFERATMLASTDPLTGLYNYRQFQSLFRDAISRAEKAGGDISLIYVDLDHFREINNTYGHQIGDEALRGIATVIRASCRDGDLVCRPGGDEFTVILPGVPRDTARMIAGRIKENLINMRLEVGLPDPLVSAIGASVGVATYPEDGADVDTLVKKADADMYLSKTKGGGGLYPTA